ncbi:MAG: hypothetical protein GAK45_01895 [Pseudomonas citronellolis]|nr:MAG: hypothetical protein GAK45_01895 [Pseudomonas citronellolis]
MTKKSRSRTWFLVHSWLAMPIWFFAFLVCVTGTLATVSQEIVWLINPAVRASAPEGVEQRLGYDALLAAIARQEPQAHVSSLGIPGETHFAVTADVSYPDLRNTTLYVNPYSGAIQGEAPLFDFRYFTRALHGWWLVPFTHGYSWGWYLVSLLGLPMLASLVTGLVVYKRFWRGFLKPRLRLNQGARIFWGDFHRLAGLWSIWFIAIISVTGTWFLIQAVLYDNAVSISTEGVPQIIQPEQVPPGVDGLAPQRASLDSALLSAERSLPGFELRYLTLPADAFAPIGLFGRSWFPLFSERAQINPYDGSLMGTRALGDRSTLELVTQSMRPLHVGDFGGLWVKLIWCFFGTLLSLMVFSGLRIWTTRTLLATAKQLKKPRRAPRDAAPVAEVAQ